VALQHGDWRDLEELSERDRALCAVAEKLSVTPTAMTNEDWQPLRDLGLDDEACLEVAHVVGIFNHLTRLADGFGLQLDPQTLAASQTGEPLRRPARS
jgi:alkylhydroperoxidase family enzyme